jgi:hypothetical protein
MFKFSNLLQFGIKTNGLQTSVSCAQNVSLVGQLASWLQEVVGWLAGWLAGCKK